MEMSQKCCITMMKFLFLLQVLVCASGAVKNRIVYIQPGDVINYIPEPYMLSPKLRIYCYNGTEKALSRLFETIELQLDIEGTDFQQYEGANEEEVREHYEQHRSIFSFTLFSQKRTRLQLSPFQTKCIGIETAQSYLLRLLQLRIDFWRVIQMSVAILLFINAARLSHNSFFYYITGILLGVCFSFMLLIWLSSKLLPRKSLMYGTIIGGWTIGVYIAHLLWENLQVLILKYRNVIIWYVLISGLISFFFCYRWGPPQNKRSKQIVSWVLQLIALGIIYGACSFEEVAVPIILILFTVQYFPRSITRRIFALYARVFPPKRRLLTQEEFLDEGVRETKKALDELREYCRSPDCAQWKVMRKLKDPLRFAEFVEGDSHLTNTEIMSYSEDVEEEEIFDTSDSEEIEEDDEREADYLQQWNSNSTNSPIGNYTSPVISARSSLNIYTPRSVLTSRSIQRQDSDEISDTTN